MEDTLLLNAGIDIEKVLRVRKALNDGTYHVSALEVADCLLRDQVLTRDRDVLPGPLSQKWVH